LGLFFWVEYIKIRCENSLNFLLAWKCEVNLKDEENGFTPLHLAVMSGNSKNVRKLLIRGADRTITVLILFNLG